MRRQLAARLGQSLIVVLIVTTISFFIVHAAPGDPFAYDSPRVTPAIRAHWRAQFGYDRPITEQFVRYVASVAHGQFGYSFQMHEPVSAALADAVPRTLLLAGLGLVLTFAIGMLVGVLQATRPNGWGDRATSGVMLLFYSLPDFWCALMVLLIFGYLWRVFPAGNIVDPVLHDYMGPWARFADYVRHLVLPVASLVLVWVAGVARHQRSAMLEVLPSDYVRTARAKGVGARAVLWRHALRTALTPMITMLGLFLPALLGGTLFVEKVFSFPGMGLLAANAISARDYDLVTATAIVGSVMVVIGNLAADLLQLALDPRVRT